MPESHANREFSKSENASAVTKMVHAVCTHDCPDSCGVLVTVDTLTGRATKVQGDPAHPVTRGFLCGKVARYLDRVYSPERLLYPMRRKAEVAKGPLPKGREAEAFERVSWDEALEWRRLNRATGPRVRVSFPSSFCPERLTTL